MEIGKIFGKKKLILFLLVLSLFILTSCTNGVTDEDINKIATNPLVTAKIQETISNTCFIINRTTDTTYDVKLRTCDEWNIANSTFGTVIYKKVDKDYIITSTTSSTTIIREPIDIDMISKNKTIEYL